MEVIRQEYFNKVRDSENILIVKAVLREGIDNVDKCYLTEDVLKILKSIRKGT